MALMNSFLGVFLSLHVQHFLYSPYCGITDYDIIQSGYQYSSEMLVSTYPKDHYTNIHCHKNCKISL